MSYPWSRGPVVSAGKSRLDLPTGRSRFAASDRSALPVLPAAAIADHRDALCLADRRIGMIGGLPMACHIQSDIRLPCQPVGQT